MPVGKNATSISQSSTGTIAVGLATTAAGAVELLSAEGRPKATIAVGAPVRDVAFGEDGSTLYVLNASPTSASLTLIRTTAMRRTASIPMPKDALSIAPTPDGSAVWSLQASGQVAETSIKGGAILTTLSVGNPGISLALAPTGLKLYVLKGSAGTANIGVVDTATSTMQRVLPAAAHSVALALGVNGAELYDFVGTADYGNVQILGL